MSHQDDLRRLNDTVGTFLAEIKESEERDNLRFQIFLLATAMHSVMSTCDRQRVACGIFKNKRLRGFGYNGAPTGRPHCDRVDPPHYLKDDHCQNVRHAEKNAISNTPRKHLRGGEAIVTVTPCIDCIKDLYEAGVKVVHVLGNYVNAKGKEYTEQICGDKMQMKFYPIDWQTGFQAIFDVMTAKGGILWCAGYRLKVTKEKLS